MQSFNVQIPRRDALWLTWEVHRRTRELCHALSIDLCELTSRSPRIVRYVTLLLRTAWCLVRRRPSLVVIQCPSVILALWVVLLRPWLRFRLVADLHNEAVVPFNLSGTIYLKAIALIHRTADLCIVTNSHLVPVVERAGGTAFVLPDKLPDLRTRAVGTAGATRNIVFVCTYAPDEPYREVIEAARTLDPSVTLFVTGNYKKVPALHPPDNVYLTGYVSERDYVAILNMADVIVDLTSMDDCLVCGAYEAVALGKPLITSDTRMLREYFHRGTVYTRHDSQSLAAAMTYALEHADHLASEIRALRVELAREWTHQRDALRQQLHLEAAGESTSGLVPVVIRR